MVAKFMLKMNSIASLKGMTHLDKSKFIKFVQTPCLFIPFNPSTQMYLPEIQKIVKPILFKVPHFYPIQDALTDPASQTCLQQYKKIYLNPSSAAANQKATSVLFERFSEWLSPDNLKMELVELNYNNWTLTEILEAVLPDKTMVSSFSVIGHVIHLNLREEHLDYKYLIGQVLLDKLSTCKCVVNKTKSIESKFRNFNMELLAGTLDTKVTTKESYCVYEFDFAEVYWNPRLSGERARILNLLNPGDVIYDVFAGVGPFSVPAAKKNCIVLANDANPSSFKWLNHNVFLNKVALSIACYQLDGSDFIRTVVFKHLSEYFSTNVSSTANVKHHVIMNLPDSAMSFLENFIGLLKLLDVPETFKLHIYLYLFHPESEYDSSALIKIIENKLNCALADQVEEVFVVRKVSPNKLMLRVNFFLNKEQLCSNGSPPLLKKIKIEDS